MGSWGAGLLDSDRALDAVGDLAEEVVADLEREQLRAPSPTTAARSATMLAILVQLGSSIFERSPDLVSDIAERQVRHSPSERSRSLLSSISAGNGPDLLRREGGRSGVVGEALGGYLDHIAPFGSYDEEPEGWAYAVDFVERCARRVDGVFNADRVNPYDTTFAGIVAAITIVLPGRIETSRTKIWRTRLTSAVAGIEDDGDRAHFTKLARNFEVACGIASAA